MYITLSVYIKIPVKFFSYQLSSAVNSCQQLMTADKVDEIKNQPRELKFGKDITNRVYMKDPVKFCSYQLSSAVKSCQQLLTADKNKNHPRELKFGTSMKFSVYTNNPVKFFLYQLSSAVISCHQLSTAFNSWYQLMKMKIILESWNFAQVSTLVCT